MGRKIGFKLKTTTSQLFQQKLLTEHKRLESGGTGEENQLLRENERNIVDNMRLVACWNVDFVERIYQDEGGIVVLNIKKQSGNV